MFSLKQLVILALAGTSFAVPMAHRHRTDFSGPATGRMPGSYGFGKHDGTNVIVYTVPSNTGSEKPSTSVVPTTSDDGSSKDTPASASAPSSGTEDGYMAVVSKWRSAGGLGALTKSAKLEANALKTANDGNGQMKHELNPGSFAQVLAPGTASNFESVYVGGWLCEKSSLKGLNGICGKMTAGWDHSDGETGHADILSSTKYTSIGCALSKGIWACDLGN